MTSAELEQQQRDTEARYRREDAEREQLRRQEVADLIQRRREAESAEAAAAVEGAGERLATEMKAISSEREAGPSADLVIAASSRIQHQERLKARVATRLEKAEQLKAAIEAWGEEHLEQVRLYLSVRSEYWQEGLPLRRVPPATPTITNAAESLVLTMTKSPSDILAHYASALGQVTEGIKMITALIARAGHGEPWGMTEDHLWGKALQHMEAPSDAVEVLGGQLRSLANVVERIREMKKTYRYTDCAWVSPHTHADISATAEGLRGLRGDEYETPEVRRSELLQKLRGESHAQM